jgi:CHAT domain-containing protein
VTHLDGAAATVDTVLQAVEERRPQILHLACHGIQDYLKPTDSAFMLHDGPLLLSTLMTKTTDGGDLAFLSACQTATGNEKLPDEAVHLAASMLSVGFKAVIGTMWSISDDDGPLVADEVYARLTKRGDEDEKSENVEDLDVAHALHGATGCLRDRVGEEDFLRWIPFVHFGR